ncbi:hypothetical protein CZ771_00375 [Actinomycetales bacterium JB111]|nr:hypothetical protein CZ771_00375 [Actinomycetales bacterium JB111]
MFILLDAGVFIPPEFPSRSTSPMTGTRWMMNYPLPTRPWAATVTL